MSPPEAHYSRSGSRTRFYRPLLISRRPIRFLFLLCNRPTFEVGRHHFRHESDDRIRADIVEAGTIEELAVKAGLAPAVLTRTVEDFNRAVRPGQSQSAAA